MKGRFLRNWASFFALYSILFVPFPFYLTTIQYDISGWIFGRLIGLVSSSLFSKPLTDNSVYSDSTSMYALVLIIAIFSCITALLLPLSARWKKYHEKAGEVVYKICVYYLALQLVKYGVDKVFKNQFYQPEPNTLFTPMGQLDKDILYWSSMGTSHFYSVFMGLLETIAGMFLFFKKTRLAGLLISFAVMLNVAAVNFGFDIGVKLFSLFLLFLTCYLLVPYTKRLYLFLVGKSVGATKHEIVVRSLPFVFLKFLVIGLILFEAFYPFLKTRTFNVDNAAKIYLHGAYEVKEITSVGDTLPSTAFAVKRIFVHRDGYMIFQDHQDGMQDYKFDYIRSNNTAILTDYQKRRTALSLTYNEKDSVLYMQYDVNKQPTLIKAKLIPWKKMPALRKGFHWTVD